MRQQWVMVPTLNLVPQPTENLVLSPDEANLQRFITPCQKFWREHWTNIHRIKALAERHPEVGTVENHKELQKARDKSEFDENGRAIRNHQSPFDLLLTLAATGAAMYVGVTANKVQTLPTFPRWRRPSSLTSASWPRRSQIVLSAAR